jgi:glycopeptide antibiotics resistance protein
MPGNRIVLKYIVWVLILLVILSVLYFSWVPNPDIGSMSIFPEWLGSWTNTNGNLRTAVPFFVLGLILELCLISKKKIQQPRWFVIMSLSMLVTFAEVGQLFLPKRHFDIMDIFWGIAGSISGIVMAISGKVLFRIFLKD